VTTQDAVNNGTSNYTLDASHEYWHGACMPIPKSSLWQACDVASGGTLASWLAEQRGAGVSHEEIIGLLRTHWDLKVTRGTLAGWLKTLGIISVEQGSAA
jgi:hypothetical protein